VWFLCVRCLACVVNQHRWHEAVHVKILQVSRYVLRLIVCLNDRRRDYDMATLITIRHSETDFHLKRAISTTGMELRTEKFVLKIGARTTDRYNSTCRLRGAIVIFSFLITNKFVIRRVFCSFRSHSARKWRAPTVPISPPVSIVTHP
jgi:hypothetical protein